MTARIALVTGVIGGIGAAIARRLSQDGATVVVTDLPGDDLNAAADTLGLPAIAADLTVQASVHDMTRRIKSDIGTPDILINAAGGVRGQVGTPLEDIDLTEWHSLFAINVDATLFLSQVLVPAMKAAGWGRIITISSGAGLRPSLTGIHAYTAAKHALVGLTKQLSQELGPFGICVNSIAPGFILSNPTTRAQWEALGEEGQKLLLDRIHTRRLGAPDDIAATAAFLTSPEAGWITGQILSVDGGVS